MPGGEAGSDDARFDEVLRLHGAALRRVAGVYEIDAARREDLFQDICLAIWQALPRFEARASVRTFVFRIAHNRGLTHRWKHRAAGQTDLDEAAASPHPGPDPEAAAVSRERGSRLREAVAGLSLGHRQAITLAMEGCSHAEIAAVLGITENNVAVRVSRARAALKKTLEASRVGAS